MTENRNQASEIRSRQRITFLIPVFCLLLSGCTFFRPPQQGLPERNSIQAGEEIIVGRNQNVYGIAHKNNVSMRDLIVLNDLKAPFVIHPGQKLILPAKNQDYAPVPSAAPLAGIEQAQLEPYAPMPEAEKTITATPLDAPQSLASNTQAPLTPITQPPPLSSPVASKPVATTVMASEPKLASMPKPAEAPQVTKPDVTFAWPVQGPIVSGFGTKGQGTSNDGINIAAPKGAPVLAAAGGIVVYAGNEMKGFGNLVLIRHEGGWVTAYAHLDRMMVARDTVVAPGDMIGTVGSTGGVASPQLHFETRLEGKPVDPQSVIKKS